MSPVQFEPLKIISTVLGKIVIRVQKYLEKYQAESAITLELPCQSLSPVSDLQPKP